MIEKRTVIYFDVELQTTPKPIYASVQLSCLLVSLNMSLLCSEHDYTTFTWKIWLDAIHHRPQNGRMKHCAANMPNTSSISSRPVPRDCKKLLPHFYSYKWEMRLSVRVTRPWAELQPGSPGFLPALNFSWNVVKFSRLLMLGQSCKKLFGKWLYWKK